MDNFKILTGYDWASDHQGFLLEVMSAPDSPDRKIVTNMIIDPVKQGAFIQPSFTLSKESVQGLFDQLWSQGYRPKDGTGNSGHIAAVQYHLEDMRKLVFVTTQSNVR